MKTERRTKLFKMGEIFTISKGKRLTKENMIEGNLNYIGAISTNNGVREKIDAPEQYTGNCITVNYNGSVGYAFYQSQPFWASDDVNVLFLKDRELTESLALFLITVIQHNRYRFSYGRKWTLEKMEETNIALPVDEYGEPDYVYMENYIASLKADHIQSHIIQKKLSLDTSNWVSYRLSDLFDIATSSDANLQSSNSGCTPYVASSGDNNGVTAYIDSSPSQKANTLTIARNGSVGSTFYHDEPYCASPDDVRILSPKFPMNKYSALFIKTVIEKEKFRYAYGRKLGTKRIMQLTIKLPANSDGSLDLDFMENYMKQLPYSDRI